MKIRNFFTLVALAVLLATTNQAFCISASEQSARQKIEKLQALIKIAEDKELDTQREECAVSMATDFLKYATWDENNIDLNRYQFETWRPYKEKAKQYAEELAEYERSEVNKLLDQAIKEIKAAIAGDIIRPKSTVIDWSNFSFENDQLLNNNRSIFVNRNKIWGDKSLKNPYHGINESAKLTLAQLSSEEGGVSKNLIAQLKNTTYQHSGEVFFSHSTPPKWMLAKDSTITVGSRHFTGYDIDNPLIRESWKRVFESIVPLYAGKKCTDFGYILSNEPSFITMKNTWATGVYSEHTHAKFRNWLKSKHQNIKRLNELWGTKFQNFESIEVEIPFNGELYGTPMVYDIIRFNQERVTEWFTFLADEIKRHDSNAKVSIKIIPRFFCDDRRDNGIDFERIVELSDIIGNDAKLTGRKYSSKFPEFWEKNYIFNWYEVGLCYDFMHSVAPHKSNLNSETHYLSTVHFRELNLSKEYTRAAYWLATLQGMDASFTWFWARQEDGSIHPSLRAGVEHSDKAMAQAYVGSLAQQPRVTHELAKTYMDMNALEEEITQIQRLRRPIRIYHSEVSASMMMNYMTHRIELYTPLFFSGNPVGFATERIIRKQDNKLWDVILIENTPFVTESEIAALQSYLDKGGSVVIDNISLKMNEYGEGHKKKLKASKGHLIQRATIKQFVDEATTIVTKAGNMPILNLKEVNNAPTKGCMWRVANKNHSKAVINIINIGVSEARLNINTRDGSKIKKMRNMLTGKSISNGFKMKPYDMLMIEVEI